MKTLTLTNQAKKTVTVLENEFIDRYMPKANGEYVKVYLMLLRHLDESASLPAPSRLADLLECTEKDILRAFKYWEGQGLLEYKEEAPDRSLQAEVSPSEASLTVAPVSGTDKSVNTGKHGNRKEFKELLFVAEQYLGKTLSATDINAITYFYETLQMSADLIEYLIEYCVENGHKSIHYIQKVIRDVHRAEALGRAVKITVRDRVVGRAAQPFVGKGYRLDFGVLQQFVGVARSVLFDDFLAQRYERYVFFVESQGRGLHVVVLEPDDQCGGDQYDRNDELHRNQDCPKLSALRGEAERTFQHQGRLEGGQIPSRIGSGQRADGQCDPSAEEQ